MRKKIAIVTDSNGGISQEMGKELGIFIVPMPFYIDGELYFEGINLTHEEFYEKQVADSEISTSQPSPGDVLELWDKILEEYEEVVHIPMSSGLSSTCDTAMALARDYDGKVVVVDNGRISVTLKQAVMDAIKLVESGKSAKEIGDILVAQKKEARIFLAVDTLKYLKKGGRVTPAAAAIGAVLNIKPVLEVRDEKIDSFAKVRGWKLAKKTMFEAMEKELKETFAGEKMQLSLAYSCGQEELELFMSETKERFPEYEIEAVALSLSVATHVGPGAMAIACSKIL